jgi:hypothetical protein
MAASLRGRDEAVIMAADSGPFAPPFALRQEISARSVGKRIGHFFGASDRRLSDKDEFKKQIDEWIRVFRKTKPPGTSGPLIDPEREAEAVSKGRRHSANQTSRRRSVGYLETSWNSIQRTIARTPLSPLAGCWKRHFKGDSCDRQDFEARRA